MSRFALLQQLVGLLVSNGSGIYEQQILRAITHYGAKRLTTYVMTDVRRRRCRRGTVVTK